MQELSSRVSSWQDNMGSKCKGCGSCLLFLVMTVLVYKLSLPVFMESFDPEGDIPSDTRDVPKMERTYSGRHIVCHTFEGGLGSLLFQYAALLTIAKTQNRLVVASGDLSLERVLKAPGFKTDRTHCSKVEKLRESTCCTFEAKLTQLDASKNYEIQGALQSWKYFKDNEDMVRKALTFQEGITHQARKVIEHALTTHNHSVSDAPAVGVHVRRGDRLKWEAVDAGYRVAPREYFIKAMKYFRQQLGKDVIFLVVSDDHKWCSGNLLGLPGVVMAGHHEPAVDLAILSLLDHSVISAGAFSWWAAFLSKGKVVYYTDFVDKDSKIRGQYGSNFEDYLYPGWVGMS